MLVFYIPNLQAIRQSRKGKVLLLSGSIYNKLNGRSYPVKML